MRFYVMYAETCVEDYVMPGEVIHTLIKGCYTSEFQYLDKALLKVEISDEGGLEFPDFIICDNCIPLVSERFYQLMRCSGVDNLFYKPIKLTCTKLGLIESYWLALPPRINCLDFEYLIKSGHLECENIDDIPAWQLNCEASQIKLIENNVGNYQIFKLAGVSNQEIIVNDALKETFEKASLDNVYFKEV